MAAHLLLTLFLLLGLPGIVPYSRLAAHTSATLSSADLRTARALHTATLLLDGRVLVAGGIGGSGTPLDSLEVFDPSTQEFSDLPRLTFARVGHTATLVPDGAVVIIGGPGPAATTVERVGPTGTVSTLGQTLMPRQHHTATLLEDGRILVAGGRGNDGTEIFDPTAGRSEAGPPFQIGPRVGHTATRLGDARVLIVNGTVTDGGLVPSAEIFDPHTATFQQVSPPTVGSRDATATSFTDGRILFSYGELFDPVSESWLPIPDSVPRRRAHASILLPDGAIWILGGVGTGLMSLATTVVVDPDLSVRQGPPLDQPRAHHAAVHLEDGRVLVIGGSQTAELDGAGTLTPIAGTVELQAPRRDLQPSASPATGSGGLASPHRSVDDLVFPVGLIAIVTMAAVASLVMARARR